MNDIAKKSISEKFTKALQTEKMQVKDAARIMGIMPTYASMVKNEALWGKCPIPVWDKILAWVNSGQTLRKYAEKHGRVLLPEQRASKDFMQPNKLAQEVKRAFGRDENPEGKELTPEETAAQGVPFKMEEEPRTEMMPEEKEMLRDSMFPSKKESLIDDPIRITEIMAGSPSLKKSGKPIKSEQKSPELERITPEPVQKYTESARLKVCLDIEINLVINGQKVQVK